MIKALRLISIFFILLSFSCSAVTAKGIPNIKTLEGRITGEMIFTNNTIKTIFLLKDSRRRIHQVFSSALASSIKDFYVKNVNVSVTGYDYFDNYGSYVGFFVQDIRQLKPQEVLMLIEDQEQEGDITVTEKEDVILNDFKRMLAYVYAEINTSGDYSNAYEIFKGNDMADVVEEARLSYDNMDINRDLVNFINALLTDEGLNHNEEAFCSGINGYNIYSSIRPDLRNIIGAMTPEDLQLTADGGDNGTGTIKYIYEEIKDYKDLSSYLSVKSKVGMYYELINGTGGLALDDMLVELKGIINFSSLEDRLEFIMENESVISDIFSLDFGISKDEYLGYVLANMKNIAIRSSKESCTIIDNVENTIETRINAIDFDKMLNDVYTRAFKQIDMPAFSISYPDNYSFHQYIINDENSITKVHYGDYSPFLSLSIGVSDTDNILNKEECNKIVDVRISGISGAKYLCTFPHVKLSKEGYYGEKVLYKFINGKSFIDIYYIKTNSELDDVYNDIVRSIEIK